MIFENPINKRVKKYEEKLSNKEVNIDKSNEPVKDDQPENIILDNINYDNKISIELIEYPKIGTITNVPRNYNMTPNQVGNISIKYEEAIGIKKVM